ncbi:MAG: ammonia channel protein, partial [Burkholderiales bacterium]|nr:ammonia channel protein [Burkholderiales bacterium]
MFRSRLILAVSLAALFGAVMAQQVVEPAAAPAAAASAAGVQTFAVPPQPQTLAAPLPAASAPAEAS